MEPLKDITTIAEIWPLGYKLERDPKKRESLHLIAPNGQVIDANYGVEALIAAVNRHRQTTLGAA